MADKDVNDVSGETHDRFKTLKEVARTRDRWLKYGVVKYLNSEDPEAREFAADIFAILCCNSTQEIVDRLICEIALGEPRKQGQHWVSLSNANKTERIIESIKTIIDEEGIDKTLGWTVVADCVLSVISNPSDKHRPVVNELNILNTPTSRNGIRFFVCRALRE